MTPEMRARIIAYKQKKKAAEDDLNTLLSALTNTQKKALVKKAAVADIFERHDIDVPAP